MTQKILKQFTKFMSFRYFTVAIRATNVTMKKAQCSTSKTAKAAQQSGHTTPQQRKTPRNRACHLRHILEYLSFTFKKIIIFGNFLTKTLCNSFGEKVNVPFLSFLLVLSACRQCILSIIGNVTIPINIMPKITPSQNMSRDQSP